jgi:hypothetical protein
VGQAGLSEVVGHLRGLAAVVAQHEAGEQGAALGGQRGGAGQQRAPDAVGQAAGRVARRPGPDLVDRQAGGHVPGGQPPPDGVGDGHEPARQPDPLPGQAVVEATGPGPAGPCLHPLAIDPHDHPQGARGLPGVIHEGYHPRPRPHPRRVQAGPRPVRQGRGGEGHAEAEEEGAAGGQSEGGHRRRHAQRQGPGGPRPAGGRQGHDHRRQLAHWVAASGGRPPERGRCVRRELRSSASLRCSLTGRRLRLPPTPAPAGAGRRAWPGRCRARRAGR